MKKTVLVSVLIVSAVFVVGIVGAFFILKANDTCEDTPKTGDDVPVILDEDPADALVLDSLGLWNKDWVSGGGVPIMSAAEKVTRLDALCLIATALGYTRAYPVLEHPYTDVPKGDLNAVGYCVYKGILSGSEQLDFSGAVRLDELAAWILRGMGDADAEPRNAMDKLRARDIYVGEYGDGSGSATRRQLSALLMAMLCTKPDGGEKTPLAFLAETGLVTVSDSIEAKLWSDALAGKDAAALTGSEFANRVFDAEFTIEYKDAEGESVGEGAGFFILDGVGVAALDTMHGATEAEIVDKNGTVRELLGVISYDVQEELVLFSCSSGGAYVAESTAPAGDNETIYVLDGDAVADVGLEFVGLFPKGLAVVGSHGEFLGFTTGESGVLAAPEQDGEIRSIYEIGMELWPEDYPDPNPRGIDPTKPMVALTFDDGPHGTYTPRLLDLLEEYNCVATFFEVGSRLESMPDFLKRMEEIGCEIGSHTYSHANLKNLTADEIYEELEKTNRIIRAEVGHDATVVRAPYGATNPDVRACIPFPIIAWNVDTLDWQSRNRDAVIDMVKREKSLDGDIVLMHSIHGSTIDAAEYIIPWLIDQGYQLVTVSELAYFRGVELENGSIYYSFPPKD